MKTNGILFVCLCALLLGGCLPKQPVADITAAENLRRTTEGRIFVTGRQALYELRHDSAGSIEAVPVSQDESCDYHAGIAQLHDWLFFVCAKQAGVQKGISFADAGSLKAYSLRDGRVVTVMALSGFQFANGLDALEPADAILIADENFLGKGGVARVRLNFDSGEPVPVDFQPRWIGRDQRVYAANGVRVQGDAVYLTDIGYVKQVPLDSAGEPGRARILYRSATVLDDLDLMCGGLVVADFVRGRLVHVPLDGSPATVSPGGLTSPSAVLAEATPLFGEEEVLVTEAFRLAGKGGNRLVRVQRADLGFPACL